LQQDTARVAWTQNTCSSAAASHKPRPQSRTHHSCKFRQRRERSLLRAGRTLSAKDREKVNAPFSLFVRSRHVDWLYDYNRTLTSHSPRRLTLFTITSFSGVRSDVLSREIDVNRHADKNAQDCYRRLGRPLEESEEKNAHPGCKVDHRRPWVSEKYRTRCSE
jgi:hypothetical protein